MQQKPYIYQVYDIVKPKKKEQIDQQPYLGRDEYFPFLEYPERVDKEDEKKGNNQDEEEDKQEGKKYLRDPGLTK